MAQDIDIKLCSYITANIKEREYQEWYLSAKHLGYKPIILGRDEVWKNKSDWGRRTKACLKFLEEESGDNIYVFTDSTDVIILDSPEDLKRKFLDYSKRTGYRVLVGGERYPTPNLRKLSTPEGKNIRTFPGPNKYPNGGLLIGYRKDLIKLYNANIDSKCDQTGYVKLISSGYPLDIDSENEIFANIPNYTNYLVYGENRRDSFDEWKYDGNKLVNMNGGYPCIVHYPGFYSNSLMYRQFKIFYPDVQIADPYPDKLIYQLQFSVWNFIGIILVLFVIFLLIVWFKSNYYCKDTNYDEYYTTRIPNKKNE